jgi:hypothetical protein
MTRMMRIVVVLMSRSFSFFIRGTAGLPLACSAEQRMPRIGTLDEHGGLPPPAPRQKGLATSDPLE